MCIKNPTVLMTRPEADAQRFVEQLKQVAGPFEAVTSPAFDYARHDVDVPEFESAIFTSKAGVAFAPAGTGRRAFCVGDATADAARDAGFDAVSADGTVEELIALILKQKQSGALTHLRGEISRGNVSARLRAAGLNCTDAVLYRKVWLMPTARVLELDTRCRNVVVPVFSVETVSILTQWPMSFEGCNVVAISEVVAREAEKLNPASVAVSDTPNMEAMALAVSRMIA